ncbi:MAG: YbjN domain-containing protein [Hyphomonadaceae bacterium]|nr:YbjN domain-containing protein [Hyphomonadaceae bacterium]
MNIADQHCLRPSPSLDSMLTVRHHPLDVFRRLAIAENYDFDCPKEDEIRLTIHGLWCNHEVVITWCAQTEKLHLYLTFDGRNPGGRSDDMCRLLSLLNERLRAGHFDFWNRDDALVYRNTHSLCGGARLRVEQAQDLIASAVDAGERGYPACQYVLWAGKSPEDALTAALLDLAASP